MIDCIYADVAAQQVHTDTRGVALAGMKRLMMCELDRGRDGVLGHKKAL